MRRTICWATLGAVTVLAVLVAASGAHATETTPAADTVVPTTTAPTTTALIAGPTTPDVTPPVVEVTRSSPFISPNGDGRLDRLTVRVTVDEPVTLSVVVRNPVGGGRAELATDLLTGPGTEALVWLGRLQRGNGTWATAGNGRMLIEVEATDGAANVANESVSVVVDTRAPTVRQNRVTPEPWSGRGLLTQRFSLTDPSRPLTVWTRILQDGRVIDQTPPRRRPANTHSIGWHPDRRGRILPVGLYQAEVVARDAAGTPVARTSSRSGSSGPSPPGSCARSRARAAEWRSPSTTAPIATPGVRCSARWTAWTPGRPSSATAATCAATPMSPGARWPPTG